jgi:hypothetical protein
LESIARRIAYVSRLQLVFLSATWIAGIYVNGFVAILPGESTGAIVLDPAVETHVILASLSAATSVFILALAWVSGSRRAAGLSLLASASIVVAGDSGLAFVLGGGSDSTESMIMATAFVTALFLTFLSMASQTTVDRSSVPVGATSGPKRPAPLALCSLSLLFFYAVFVSGIYVNLFVAGPVFSLPLGLEAAAFTQAEHSAAFVTHEALGAALLVILALFSVSLWLSGARRLSVVSAVPVLLVAYSAYVGSLNLTSSPVPLTSSTPTAVSVVVTMLSSAGFMAATVITILIALKVVANGRQRRLGTSDLAGWFLIWLI